MNTFTICLIIWASDKLTRLGRSQDVTKEYIGCYGDGASEDTKIFTEFGRYLPEWNTTKCREICLNLNSFYYGISQKCMCFCGNSSSNYTQYGKKDEIECEDGCMSNTPKIKVYEVQCPKPENPKNGIVQLSHRTARFTCERGFNLNGSEEINCIKQNDTISWNMQQPTCVTVNPTVSTTAPSSRDPSTATVRTHQTQAISVKTTENAVEETTAEAVITISQTTHSSTAAVINVSLPSTKKSTEGYLNLHQTILTTSDSSLSSNVSLNYTSTGAGNTTNSRKDAETENGIIQLFLHLLIAILPVIIIFFFILLSCCCSLDDRKYRKRKSIGDTTCGPSSFEFMTPRVIKRQFSASTLPMTYNRSFGMYSSKPNLKCDNEIDQDDELETDYEDDHIYFELASESNDNEIEEDGVIYV